MTKRPTWCDWEIELSSHVTKRMRDRGFSEADLRHMMEVATAFRRHVGSDRWTVQTIHEARRWEVTVDPDSNEHVVAVITAHPCEAQ